MRVFCLTLILCALTWVAAHEEGGHLQGARLCTPQLVLVDDVEVPDLLSTLTRVSRLLGVPFLKDCSIRTIFRVTVSPLDDATYKGFAPSSRYTELRLELGPALTGSADLAHYQVVRSRLGVVRSWQLQLDSVFVALRLAARYQLDNARSAWVWLAIGVVGMVIAIARVVASRVN